MKNKLINKAYYNMYSNFVKQYYRKVSEISNTEEIYYREGKLVVLVRDEILGQRIYDVIKTLKDKDEVISTGDMTFRIDKFITDEFERVKVFCINFHFEKEWSDFSKIEKLQKLVTFAKNMQSKGYVLDDSKFENEKCSSICEFFSFFSLNNGQKDSTDGCLVKYIHYILSDGGSLDEFYQNIVDSNKICKISEFPYALPIIKLCYNYFVTGNVSEDICDILRRGTYELCFANYYDDYLISSKSSFEALKVIENNDEYTIYDGNIKIYHNISSEFERFLRDKGHIDYSNTRTVEEIDTIIISFDGNIIGYKFLEKDMSYITPILNVNVVTQKKLFMCLSDIWDSLLRVKTNDRICFDFKTCNEKHDFNIEKSLFYNRGDVSVWSDGYIFTNIKELFNFLADDENSLKKQFTIIFFKLYYSYLSQKYGEMHEEKQFFEKKEVRFLSPVIAREFINYALGKNVDYEVVTEEFYKFLYETKTKADAELCYDSRFEYNPLKVPFLLENEAEEKYGITFHKDMNKELPDGRRLITFNRSKKISRVKELENSLRDKIWKKIGPVVDDNVEIVGISEIIYSNNINAENMHNVIGYITGPIKGKQLTERLLLNLNNRDFLRVAGYLFRNFRDYYINGDSIWMDENFKFYINILDDNFQIKRSESINVAEFISSVIDYLKRKGYNPNAFIDLDSSLFFSKQYFLDLADSMNAYCEEHGIYYNGKEKACPVCLKSKYFVSRTFEEDAIEVFEDLYAKHYKIDKNYNIKIYKTSCENMDSIEKNIDNIINRRLSSKESMLGQDCFVPYKKAIRDDKFIGYIYNAVQFNNNENDDDVCNDIKNLEIMGNLPRLKSLIRLILQIKEVTKNGYGFMINNPFTHVFLSKSHKKQVQILNIEFLSEKVRVKDTIEWTCKYVSEVINADDSIEVDVSDCSTDLDSILTKLQLLSKDMTKYCPIHKMNYRSNYLFCPRCIDTVQMENIEVKEMEKSEFTRRKPDNEGGEAFIYSYGDNSVVKIFKEEGIDYNFKSLIIAYILGKKEVLEKINSKNLKYKYIIPQKILIDENLIYGYIMDKVHNGLPLSTLKDTDEVKRLGFVKKDVLEILITVGEGIETLHANDIFIGDLNGQNILFDTQKNVYFLDFDGMGVGDISPKFCTDKYIDPISDKTGHITKKDDWYSFAIQAFYYLTFTHPFNGIYSVKENGKKVILDIPDKMERRISLLGKHGMNPPDIAEPWDWMSKKLKKAFLKIFEGDYRESIVPELLDQYVKLYGNNKTFDLQCDNEVSEASNDTSIRINPKFIATELNPFDVDVVRVINHYTAVYREDNEYYIRILSNNELLREYYRSNHYNDTQKILNNIQLPDWYDIRDILLSDDEEIAFVIYEFKVIVIDLKTNNKICEDYTSHKGYADVVVNGRTLYFTKIFEEENVIFQVDFMSNGDIKESAIKFLKEQETKKFYAKFNSKFVIVKQATETIDIIYCNSERLCDINHSFVDCSYNILYDDVTKLWVVINSEGEGIIITSHGKYSKFDIQKIINDINIENISFNKGFIYFPSKDYLYIININDQMTTKKMECHGIMTSDSKLYDFNTDGFSVITDNILYEVRKG